MMRKLPTITAALFLLLTLERVAGFTAEIMGASAINAFLFSGGLAVAVYVSAYYSRSSAASAPARKGKRRLPRVFRWNARTFARLALAVFIVCDGLFNLAHALRNVAEPAYTAFAVVYGIFPTLAAGLLGLLQGYVDKLPHKRTHGVDAAQVVASVRAWIAERRTRSAEPEPVAPVGLFVCACGCTFGTQQGRAAHMRHCVKRNGHAKKEAVRVNV